MVGVGEYFVSDLLKKTLRSAPDALVRQILSTSDLN